ncbi:anaerobic ribonucleoside-triphosphate reductase activating protein [Candidatus Kuenenbacteria bacterium CG_4_8_14_3_um_filter_39_15]|uniref:Anaerobic ribonucleoside-triphosphate reductase activating protein n=3 Tax=Candidatus Kueneniibacteriota TaxID=1752740 RepID=A0A2M7IL08_9BACT|nr:MAG: anaerobic ribonucleoside-triphosphate reductase activating protein [Candidatus Kuenenbacteria bacterium CG22_combo_CG10-13_8_21_14_all_39_9]PIW95491.1 MAG: anaerobic ribonucleoside-triphosphate reductase activating protein [Candidatus Kuenenbacteria bacterium CG_4_8_14_3_um_filter_39_15]PIX92608.1 MAG: anaerobic ribonucleoside-triphosphate reductase activating protein [Candidatus Kuenenbacteria bacterium CG_4_10_14_3_um_filter_39_14]
MLIGGLQKTSLLDYPQKVSAIIFTISCNFRCPFCYNSNLVTKINKGDILPPADIFEFLKRRKKVLDAVVITGGEPTRHADLPEFIRKIKEMGFLVKLDTNGTNPSMLKKLIQDKLVDYLAMDIKGPLPKYSKIVNVTVSTKKIRESIKIIMHSNLPYEFRSTILPALHSRSDLEKMAKLIKGAKKYYLQKFQATGDLNNQDFNNYKSFTDQEMHDLCDLAKNYVEKCGVR